MNNSKGHPWHNHGGPAELRPCGGKEGEGGPDGERTRLLTECGNSQIQVGHLDFYTPWSIDILFRCRQVLTKIFTAT